MDDNLEWMFKEEKKIDVSPYKGEIGSLERQIDELIGFTAVPVKSLKGAKRQYAMRMGLIREAKDQAPPEVVKQIEKLEDSLSRLRHAKEIQHSLDASLDNLENNQKNNKNIQKVIEIVSVSGSKRQRKYNAEFLERMKDMPLVINYNGAPVALETI